ncbi:unnamed protein product [Amaranthus hypochondriacus]
MDETKNTLQQPLLPTSVTHATTTETTTSGHDTTTSSTYALSVRLLMFISIGAMSVWASHEASKGFMITVKNSMINTSLGQKFNLFYVSNDEAIRLVQNSSSFASKILFPADHSRILEKLIEIEVQFVSDHNLTNYIHSFEQKSKYIIFIDSYIMGYKDFKYRITKEIMKKMGEILLINLRNKAPNSLLDGMVEYINDLAGFGDHLEENVMKLRNNNRVIKKCWEDNDSRLVAKFLGYAEEKCEGFVGKLNEEMGKNGWFEEIMDKLLGMETIQLCSSFHDSMIKGQYLRYDTISV